VSYFVCVIQMYKDKGSARDLFSYMVFSWLSSEGVIAAVFKRQVLKTYVKGVLRKT